MLFAARTGSATRFFEALMEGEPVAWIILGAVLFFMALGAWQKYRKFSQ